jgi:type I restriction enzyme S subunit
MSEWKEYRISELCELIGGGTPKTTVPEYWGGDIPWLSVTDFNTGKKYCFNADKKITEKGLKESSTKILKKGQIIISARGTVGVISMLGRDMAFNQSNYGIDAKKDLTSNNFLFYLLKDNVPQFISNSYGAVFDTITKETFDQIKVLIPSLYEQTAIASILSSLDDKIDLLHRQNKTLEQLAETLFRQWFVEEAEEQSNKQLLLGDLIETVSNTHKFPSNKVVFLNTSDIYKGEVLIHEQIEVNTLPGQAKKSIQKNDILYSEIRPANGRYAYIDFDSENYVVSTKLMVLRSKNILSQAFIYFYLINTQTVEWLQMIAESRSGTFPQITFDQLRNLKINVPSDIILNDSIHWCETAIEKIKSHTKQIRTLTQFRDTLLPKLMSGEVRVEN